MPKHVMLFAFLLVFAGCSSSGGGDVVEPDFFPSDAAPDMTADEASPPEEVEPEDRFVPPPIDVVDVPDPDEDVEIAHQDDCVPDCGTKECGDNGCGGTCGGCGGGLECNEDGLCILPGCKSDDDCPDEQFCNDDSCQDDECTPGEVYCENDAVFICLENGSGFELAEQCGPVQYCEDGACHDMACVPGEPECEGDVLFACDAAGKEMTEIQDCAAGGLYCFEGACMDTLCIPGVKFCASASSTSVCTVDGMGYEEIPCPEQHYCKLGECLLWNCEPAEPMCDGQVATVCDPSGEGPEPGGEDCFAGGLLCSSGVCVDCYPECFGKECGDDGCGGDCGACDDGNPCTSGECEQAVFMCQYTTIPDCCLLDAQCTDEDPCTVDSCTDNVCWNTDMCCQSHGDCTDMDDECTHDLCLNNFCWYAPKPGSECCPKYTLFEGFEYTAALGWSLADDGVHKWELTGDAVFDGGYSLVATSWHNGATATLPGPFVVPHNGASLEFHYLTVGWLEIDCSWMGITVYVNGAAVDLICEPAPLWQGYALDLSAWAGQTVTVQIAYDVSNNGNPDHRAYLDEVHIVTPCCTSDSHCDDGDYCTADSCGDDGACYHEPDPGCCHPALLQQDFEDGLAWGWELSSGGLKKWAVSSEEPHTGQFGLLCDQANSPAVFTLPGTYVLPPSGGVLKMWMKTVNWNVITWGVDGISVYVNGTLAAVSSNPSPQWSLYTLDLGAWAGQEVTVEIGYSLVAQGNQGHKVLLDDIQLVQACCDEDSECDDGNPCTEDECGLWGACLHEPDEECCNPEVFAENFDFGVAPKWGLTQDGQLEWSITEEDAKSGGYSLTCWKGENGAVATLPLEVTVPWAGANFEFWYKTVDWNALNCETDGIAVYVNDQKAGSVCDPAEAWTLAQVDLTPWVGQTVIIRLAYSVTSPGNGNHKAFVDDVRLVQVCCEADEQCDDGDGCTEDACAGGVCTNESDPACCGMSLFQEDFEMGSAWNWILGEPGQSQWTLFMEEGDGGLYSLHASATPSAATLPGQHYIPASGALFTFFYRTENWALIDCEAKQGITVLVNGVAAGSACTTSPEWGPFNLDLAEWGGQTVTLQVKYNVPNTGNPGHKGWIDNFDLVPVCCEEDGDYADGWMCTFDVCGAGGGCVHQPLSDCCDPAALVEDFDDGVAWGWNLMKTPGKSWAVTAEDALSPEQSLIAGKGTNTAVAVLPLLPVIPWEGSVLKFHYKTVDWNIMDCSWLGVSIYVNGIRVASACEAAPEWTMFTYDLLPWSGQSPVVELEYFVGDGGNPNHKAYIDDVEVYLECP